MDATKVYLILVGTIVILASLASLILLNRTIRRRRSKRSRDTPISLSVTFTICAAMFYFISSALFLAMIRHFNNRSNNNFSGNEMFVILAVLFVFSLICAKTSIYSKFLYRIRDTFKSSVLELSPKIIILALSLISALFIVVVWWIILIVHRHIIHKTDYDGYNQQFIAVFVLLLLLDCSISYLVVGLMINKLFKTIHFKSRKEFFEMTDRYLSKKHDPPRQASSSLSASAVDSPSAELDDAAEAAENAMQRANTSASASSEANSEKALHVPSSSLKRSNSFRLDLAYNSIDREDKERLGLITRQFLLSVLAIMTTQLCYLSLVIALIVESARGTEEFDQRAYAVLYGGLFYPMEALLSALAMYFEYNYADKPQHYELCCSACHERCKRYVVRRASMQILNQHAEHIDAVDVHKSVEES